MMKSQFGRILCKLLCGAMVLNILGCGTILHPERKGQTDGQLDTSIVVLDAIGLLFFFVPGVIAFAVDFSNGTIYLPGGSSAALSEDQLEQISSSGKIELNGIASLIESLDPSVERPGIDELEITALNSTRDLGYFFAVSAIPRFADR